MLSIIEEALLKWMVLIKRQSGCTLSFCHTNIYIFILKQKLEVNLVFRQSLRDTNASRHYFFIIYKP